MHNHRIITKSYISYNCVTVYLLMSDDACRHHHCIMRHPKPYTLPQPSAIQGVLDVIVDKGIGSCSQRLVLDALPRKCCCSACAVSILSRWSAGLLCAWLGRCYCQEVLHTAGSKEAHRGKQHTEWAATKCRGVSSWHVTCNRVNG